jgi:hypothetical protein
MRFLASGGLLLYGLANVVAGFFDLVTVHRWGTGVDAALLLTGALLLLAGILTVLRSRFAFAAAVVSLGTAFALAVFNERFLGLGHPGHHLVRGLYTALVLWAAYRGSRLRDHPSP